MTDHPTTAYALWSLVALNAGIVILFAASFFRPTTARDWRTLGTFSAFVVALFAEMYGFPLTIYLLGAWLGGRLQAGDMLSHDTGHLWFSLLGLEGDPHTHPVHLLSSALIVAGFALLASAWRALHSAQQRGVLAVRGPYWYVRHPQYAALLLIMLGFLLQWPTLATLVMFPILAWSYARLAWTEEQRMEEEFGCCWQAYAHARPAFVPRLSRLTTGLVGVLKDRRENGAAKSRPVSPAPHGRTQS